MSKCGLKEVPEIDSRNPHLDIILIMAPVMKKPSGLVLVAEGPVFNS